VVKSWQGSLDLLPECCLKDEIIQACHNLIATLPQGFAKGLPEPFRKGMPNPEQEQELEQEPEKDAVGSSPLLTHKTSRTHQMSGNGRLPNARISNKSHTAPDDFPREPTPEQLAWAHENAPHVDVHFQHRRFLNHHFREPHSDWVRAWNNWMLRGEQDWLEKHPNLEERERHSGRSCGWDRCRKPVCDWSASFCADHAPPPEASRPP
jgi:hypothetical protein